MSENDGLELLSPIFKVKAGQLLDWTIPIINVGIKVPMWDIELPNLFAIAANEVFNILMALGDRWAREYYEEES